MDDEPRRRSMTHEVGMSLDTMSVGELEERIALLEEEIARLEDAKKARSSSRDAAHAAFKI